MTALSIAHLVTESQDGVSVIGICDLLDDLYGVDRWFDVEPELRNERVISWLQEHDAHYYAWEGPSFYRLAEQNKAVQEAQELSKSIVVIEPLS